MTAPKVEPVARFSDDEGAAELLIPNSVPLAVSWSRAGSE